MEVRRTDLNELSDESQMDVEQTKVAVMATLLLVMLQHRSQCCCCCSDGVATLLLLQRWRHGVAITVVMVLQHYSSRRCNVVRYGVVARDVATLQHCGVTTRGNGRQQRTMQRW